MILRQLLFAALCLMLIGCSQTPDPVRIAPEPQSPGARISIPHQSVALREVSLPAYATDESISIADGTGAIRELPGSIWADDPTRAVTLRLTNALADLTGRTVASDPWPFGGSPEVVVDVRIERLLAEEGGRYLAQGRYYIAHEDEERTDRAGSFNLIESYDPALGFPAIAQARSQIIAALAREIAQRGLR